MASLSQDTTPKVTYQTTTTGFALDLYTFGAAREMVVSAVSTCIETIAKLVA